MIRLTSFLKVWFQCVCPLMPSWNTYHLTWVSLTLGRGVSLHGCSSKAQLLLLTLHEGYATFPDLKCEITPLSPPAPTQPWLLGHGVGPPGHRPWPQSCGCSSPSPLLASGLGAWGSSSRPSPLASGLGCSSWPPPLTSDAGYLLSATPPDLGCGVAPLGCSQPPALWRAGRSRLRYSPHK